MKRTWKKHNAAFKAKVALAAVKGDRTHVDQPSLRIDVVQLGGLDQREYPRGTLATAVGAGESSGAAAYCNSAQCPFGGIVGQADRPVIEKPGEGRPALQHVVNGLGGVDVARQAGCARSASSLPMRRPAA